MSTAHSNWQVRNEDCLVGLAEMPDASVDFIFADPPYLLSNGGMSVANGKQVAVDKGLWDKSYGFKSDVEFHRTWLSLAQEKLAADGSLMVSGTYHSIYKCGFLMEELGFRILNELIWFKPNGAPNIGLRTFAASHETLIWGAKSKSSRHVFNYEVMKNSEFLGDKLKSPGKQMRSVWSIPTTPASEKTFGRHPTQKPQALLDRIIEACTNPGDLVVDPFCGSGTTGVAAVKAGRAFVGFEIDKQYSKLAIDRLSQIGGAK